MARGPDPRRDPRADRGGTTSIAPTALPPLAVPAAEAVGAQGLLSTALPLLSPGEAPLLGFWIAAGVLAAATLRGAAPAPAATLAELEDATPVAAVRDPWLARRPDLWVATSGCVGPEAHAMSAGGSWAGMWSVGKRAAGRDLDGRAWDERPAALVQGST